jgi:hypothetical protein
MRKCITIIFLCAGCLEPYSPPATVDNLNALVVDGFIDANGSASVRLSRTLPIKGEGLPPKETGAIVTIGSSAGQTFSLHEDSLGLYTSNSLPVDFHSTYVLHVVTADNSEYVSDEMKIYPTSPIDSVYWTISGAEQLEIKVDSHDTNPDAPGYYLTNGIETYEYHAPLYSPYKLIGMVAVQRTPEEEIFACWRSVLTPNSLSTTKGLSQKVTSGVKVSLIDRGSVKLSVRYSILVRQRAISEEEYTYQKQLKASTEQQGSLYAQIPGTVLSNIHSVTNPGEYVLGYFHGQDIKEYRYFVGPNDHPLPQGFRLPQPDARCQPEATCRTDQPLAGPSDCVPVSALGSSAIITDVLVNSDMIVVAVFYVRSDCGDCKVKGGTTNKPPFW